jgi:glycosyltransferase involved in cell wall biosynthesis
VTKPPAVTVVLIFFNETRYLQEAVDSVFAQTYADWELLLVDDGSTDGSSAVAQACAAAHPDRVRYLEHENHANRGMSATRNLGIREARGRFITFLDADDVWQADKLRIQVSLLDAHEEAGLVIGRLQYWHSWNPAASADQQDFIAPLREPLDVVVQPPELLRVTLADEWVTLSNLLIRRHVVETIGGYDDSFRGLYEDQVFHAKLCLEWPVVVSSHVGYRYRQHKDSCVSSSDHKRTSTARLRFLAWLDAYLDARQVADPTLRQIIRTKRLATRYPRAARLRTFLLGR